jgi:hypothetical protein
MRKNLGRLTGVGLTISLLALAPLASASNATATSTPNGDVNAISSSGTSTNKDNDADFNTLTQADRLGLFYAVANNSETAQTIHITVTLDGPGTGRDFILVDEDVFFGPWTPEQGSTISQGRFEFQVKHKEWPEGSYSLSVTGSGSESVTATSTFTIAYGK